MRLLRLNKKNIEQTLVLIKKIFDYEGQKKEAEEALRDSLILPKLKKIIETGKDRSSAVLSAKKEYSRLTKNKVDMSYYWICEIAGEIAGVTGLTWYKDDPGEVWLGWYCVNHEFRGKGLGTKLLDFSMEQARKKGFSKMKIWTSTLPEERSAQKLYVSRGFRVYDRERFYKNKKRQKGYTDLFRVVEL